MTDGETAGGTAAANEPKTLCNATTLSPNDDLANNAKWVDEFKGVNRNPTAGYSQHVNNIGLTTFDCVDRLSNESVQRIALASLEVLAQRASLKGNKEHGLDESKAPEDAAKRLVASAEFAKKRPALIHDSKLNEVYNRVQANAKRSGIILNLPPDAFGEETEGAPETGGKHGKGKNKQTAGAA